MEISRDTIVFQLISIYFNVFLFISMKGLGYILISVGIALLIFVGYNFIKEKNKMASPIPEDKGVRIIFVTPKK